MQIYHAKCQDGWITSWNQDCQEKYQPLQIHRWYHSNGRKWRGTKGPLMRVKKESEKAGLKLNIQNTKITASSSPITSWQIDGETVTDFIFLGCKITVDGDSSHEIKRFLLLGRKPMTNLESILKSRDITLTTKVSMVKANFFSSSNVQMRELDHKEGRASKN